MSYSDFTAHVTEEFTEEGYCENDVDCITQQLEPNDFVLLKSAIKVTLNYFVGLIHGIKTRGYNTRIVLEMTHILDILFLRVWTHCSNRCCWHCFEVATPPGFREQSWCNQYNFWQELSSYNQVNISEVKRFLPFKVKCHTALHTVEPSHMLVTYVPLIICFLCNTWVFSWKLWIFKGAPWVGIFQRNTAVSKIVFVFKMSRCRQFAYCLTVSGNIEVYFACLQSSVQLCFIYNIRFKKKFKHVHLSKHNNNVSNYKVIFSTVLLIAVILSNMIPKKYVGQLLINDNLLQLITLFT